MRALRSISGRVLLRVQDDLTASSALKQKREAPGRTEPARANEQQEMVPVAGVQVTAGPSSATTDKEGKFLLRNLPAGDLNVSIKPVRSVPQGINIPTGSVKLPVEPVQIQGATIVVTNAELLPYLTEEMLTAPTTRAQQAIRSAYTRARERDKQQSPLPLAGSSRLQPKAASPTPIAPGLQPNQAAPSPAVVARAPAQSVPPQQASTAATIPPSVAVRSGEQPAISYEISRAICASMPSLGEAAQCFNQLKRTEAANSKK